MQLEPKQFSLETTSVWSFPERGDWATHDAKYRGNWSPYIPRNLLLRYSMENDLVLDPFVGGGTTLVEAKLLNRDIIGVDVNPAAIKRCQEKTAFNCSNSGKVYIKQGDARKLKFIPNESIDFICTHPPYADIIRYSDGIDGDISNCNINAFLVQMKLVAKECFRILKIRKFCAILMGDTRKRGRVVPMSFDVMKVFENEGFRTKEIIIKEQHNCRFTGRWKASSAKNNFLLLSHEYLFVFIK
jgi:DNA modification methylase